MRAERRGLAVLEALVALSLMSIAGAAWVASILQVQARIERAHADELELLDAEGILESISTLSASELDGLVGRRAFRGRTVTISRLTPTVYHVMVLADSRHARALGTLLHRERGGER